MIQDDAFFETFRSIFHVYKLCNSFANRDSLFSFQKKRKTLLTINPRKLQLLDRVRVTKLEQIAGFVSLGVEKKKIEQWFTQNKTEGILSVFFFYKCNDA